MLKRSGWKVHSKNKINCGAGLGNAVREYKTNGQPVGKPLRFRLEAVQPPRPQPCHATNRIERVRACRFLREAKSRSTPPSSESVVLKVHSYTNGCRYPNKPNSMPSVIRARSCPTLHRGSMPGGRAIFHADSQAGPLSRLSSRTRRASNHSVQSDDQVRAERSLGSPPEGGRTPAAHAGRVPRPAACGLSICLRAWRMWKCSYRLESRCFAASVRFLKMPSAGPRELARGI